MKPCIIFISLIFLWSASICHAELPLGKKAPPLLLHDSCGGRLNGTPWSSSEITEKVSAIYYVDPDEADLNEPLYTALKRQNFPPEKIQSVAIINMKATWLPKPILNMALKRKQRKYPRTTYVNDYCRSGISQWKFADNSSDVLVFDQAGRVIFSKNGKLSEEDITQVINVIRNAIIGNSTLPQ